MTSLVIGLGNSDRGDDGIGVAVARRVAQLAPAGIDVVEHAEPASLVDAWTLDDDVVIIDAMVSGAVPGSLRIVDATRERLPASGWSAGGTHGVGLADAVELARALGRMPRRLVVVGIEIDGDLRMGEGLSVPVRDAADAAVEAVLSAQWPTAAAPK